MGQPGCKLNKLTFLNHTWSAAADAAVTIVKDSCGCKPGCNPVIDRYTKLATRVSKMAPVRGLGIFLAFSGIGVQRHLLRNFQNFYIVFLLKAGQRPGLHPTLEDE